MTLRERRAPLVGDLDVDSVAAYNRHLERVGGRHGGPAAPATRRIYLALLRAAVRELHGDHAATGIRVPADQPGPPETVTEADYHNLLRVPDRRTMRGKRDHALLRVLGDCGLRSAELRGLTAGQLRRPRANARHWRLHVHGKRGRRREVPIPTDTKTAIDAWLAVHPLAQGRPGLADHEPLFVRLGRRGEQPAEPLSAQAVYKLVHGAGLAAGVPERLCHPHALRTYWATHLLDDGVPVYRVRNRLGHSDLRTTARYLAEPDDQVDGVADIIDRREQSHRRDHRR